MSKRVFIVAVEPSGDALAADFIASSRRKDPSLIIEGVGGDKMAGQGVVSKVPIEGLSVLGLTEVLGVWKTAVERAQATANAAAAFKPDIVVLVDSWGFTVRAAKRIRALMPEVPLIKMVGPQVFATRPGRAKRVAQVYDGLFCIHQFEVPYYVGLDIQIDVIGNPAVSRGQHGDGAGFCKRHRLEDRRILLLLPGSRKSEIELVCPILEEGARLLCATRPDVHVVCVMSPAVETLVRARAEGWAFPHFLVREDEKLDAFNAGSVALACSGTVTTEVALQNTPMIVGYRLGPLTAFIALNFMLKTPYVTLMNIAAGRMIVPEFIQDRFTPEAVSAAAAPLLDDLRQRAAQVEDQNAALDAMGRHDPPAADLAADALLRWLDRP
jgi:lipid-A-disaccharide synthase